MKRKYSDLDNVNSSRKKRIDQELIDDCKYRFDSDPLNAIVRNSVVSVGSLLSSTNSNRLNEITHVFLNTVKKKNLKATDQGQSGRCWMFAALNTFRHFLIKALDLDSFEFSETYLFFWDKFERCNYYMQWFIDHPEFSSDSREVEYMVMYYMGDGGWWNTFANVVNKYGLIPKNRMNETITSQDSEDLNQILKNTINNFVYNLRKKKMSQEMAQSYKNELLRKIYDNLVKFLGEPPQKFTWTFTDSEEESKTMIGLTPVIFRDMVIPGLDLNNDFVVLTNCPTRDMKCNQNYTIKYTQNVFEGGPCTMFNTKIDELEKYAMKSIDAGIAVWFGSDVTQSFNLYHSVLDDQLDDRELLFNSIDKEFSKGDRISLRNIQANHAMALTGYNVDEKGVVTSWQVENSWGYWDNETPGLDGFLLMSDTWFRKYVIEIVVMKRLLSRTMKRKIRESQPLLLEPWDSMAPATRVGVLNRPSGYLRKK